MRSIGHSRVNGSDLGAFAFWHNVDSIMSRTLERRKLLSVIVRVRQTGGLDA